MRITTRIDAIPVAVPLAQEFHRSVGATRAGGKYRLQAGPGHRFEIHDAAVAHANERFQRDGAYVSIELSR